MSLESQNNMTRLEKNKPKILYIAIAEWIYVTASSLAKRRGADRNPWLAKMMLQVFINKIYDRKKVSRNADLLELSLKLKFSSLGRTCR